MLEGNIAKKYIYIVLIKLEVNDLNIVTLKKCYKLT